MTNGAYIVAAARTSVVPMGGAFRDLDYESLAVPPLRRCLEFGKVSPDQVDDVVLSNALGAGGNPARVVALASGLPQHVAGLSIDRQCAGGLDAVVLAHALILSGQADVVLAGGSESYSLRPERRFKTAWDSAPESRNQARFTPWHDNDPDMAEAADRLADLETISRTEQDAWAIASHSKARSAAPRTSDEIANPSGTQDASDPFTRNLTTRLCARAPTVAGTITAANMCVAADGAAFVLVVSRRLFERLNPEFAVRITGGRTVGGDPTVPGMAPVAAMRRVLADTNISPNDLSAAEVMEAFAVQAIACVRGADLNPGIVNRSGGSLARGHPIGASGAILAVRLFHELREADGPGIAAIASAGGLGTALLAQRVAR